MTTSSLSSLARATATTKRSPAPVSGKITEPVAQITVPFPIIPPVPYQGDIAEKLKVKSIRQQWVTYTENDPQRNIRKGDVLTATVQTSAGPVSTDYLVTDAHPYQILIQWSEIIMDLIVRS